MPISGYPDTPEPVSRRAEDRTGGERLAAKTVPKSQSSHVELMLQAGGDPVSQGGGTSVTNNKYADWDSPMIPDTGSLGRLTTDRVLGQDW